MTDVRPHDMRAEFAERGTVRLDGAFSIDDATRIRDAVHRYAERKTGVVVNDHATWPEGWLQISWKGLKRDRVFDALTASPMVQSALDAIFDRGDGKRGWARPKPGAQVLFNLPSSSSAVTTDRGHSGFAGEWVLPDGWHMDCGFERPTWPVFAVKLFAFFGPVAPRGGGTMILPGTHRVVDRYRRDLAPATGGGMATWRPFMEHHPFLRQLLQGSAASDGGRSLVGTTGDVDGVPVEVVELTGEPGDVVITHLHVFHSASPNHRAVPRQMLGKAVMAVSPEEP